MSSSRARRPTAGRWSPATSSRSRSTASPRLTNTVVDWDVDLSGPGDQLQVSANTLHVALAIPEDEAEQRVREGRLEP